MLQYGACEYFIVNINWSQQPDIYLSLYLTRTYLTIQNVHTGRQYFDDEENILKHFNEEENISKQNLTLGTIRGRS